MIRIRIKKNIKTLQKEHEELLCGIELFIEENSIVVSQAKTLQDICRLDNYSRSVYIKSLKDKNREISIE